MTAGWQDEEAGEGLPGAQETRRRYRPASASPRFTGPATFFRLPHVPDRRDADVAVIGVPFDTGVTYRIGGRFAPGAVREASSMLRAFNPSQGVRPFDVLSCVDGGDVVVVPGDTQATYAAIEADLGPVFAAGTTPILVGGDHAVTLGHLRAARACGRGPAAVVNFDSHTDAWDTDFGLRYNHGTWLRRGIEEGLVDPARTIEVGLRGSLFADDDWTSLRDDLGLDYRTTDDVYEQGLPAISEAVHARVGTGPVFVSFDIDVIDPAFAPGTGTPEPGGVTSRQALNLVRGLKGLDFLGFDVVEVIPAFDPAGQTTLLAANIAYEFISLVALRGAKTIS